MKLIRPRFLLLALLVTAPCRADERAQPVAPSKVGQDVYALGPDDEIVVQGIHLEELANKPVRVDNNGDINLPMAGRIHVGGLTVRAVEDELRRVLSEWIKEPQVTVAIVTMRSQRISVLGAVNNPGGHELLRGRSLAETLSAAGGLRPDAGYSVKIMRRMEWGEIPLPNARLDAGGRYSVAEVNLQSLLEGKNPELNIPIMPQDVITVPKASMIYVIGEVRKSGGFVMSDRSRVSVLQALSLAEGLQQTAAPANARIMRGSATDGAERKEVAVDVKKILSGKEKDVYLEPDDILFIPGSTGKRAFLRGLEAAIQTGSGIAIWRTAR